MTTLITKYDEDISRAMELSYRRYLVRVCMVVALPALIVFTIRDFYIGRLLVGFTLLTMILILASLFFLIRKPQFKSKENLFYQYFLTALFILFGFYLVYSIGFEGDLSRIPWAYVFPVMVFFALGASRAMLWVILLLASLLSLDFYLSSNEHALLDDLKLRFYISFLLVIMASFFFERLKKRYQSELIENQRTLQASENRYRNAYEQLEKEVRERRRTEAALRESEESYRALVEDMPALVCRFIPDGTLTFVNDSYCRYFEKTRDALVGANFFQFIPEEERENVKNQYRSLTREKPVINYEHKVLAIDGSIRWQSWTDRALFDETGNLNQYQSIGVDITKSKRTEQALRESEERFREMAELMPQTVFEMDLTGRLTFVNRNAFDTFGYTQQDFDRGLSSWEIITPQDRHRAMENVAKILNGEAIGLNEYTARRKDGSTFPIMIHSAAIVREGQLMGLRGFIIDMTERKRAEEERIKLETQFQQAQRLETIGTLAGGIAHDFNNLMTTILGNTSLVLYDIDPSHPHYEPLKNIERQIKRGAELTTQLLGYARKGKYYVKPVSLNLIVEESSTAFGRTRKELTILRELASGLSPIEADKGQIQQVLLNLFVNAADAMPDGGKLILKTKNVRHNEIKSKHYDPTPGNYVSLSVTDTGVGMDENILERIFDPFFTTKETGKGSGLGLASVYGIVKNHGGYIDVQSEKNRGTCFRIFFPASDKKVTEPKEPTPEIKQGSGTILIVDDEEMVLDIGIKVLKKLGYTVLNAKNGLEAVALFQEHGDTINLVILDIVMPDIGGGEVYDRLKEIRPDVKVLLSSGYSIDGQARDIMDRGCDGFIQKPFSMKALSEKLSEILANK